MRYSAVTISTYLSERENGLQCKTGSRKRHVARRRLSSARVFDIPQDAIRAPLDEDLGERLHVCLRKGKHAGLSLQKRLEL